MTAVVGNTTVPLMLRSPPPGGTPVTAGAGAAGPRGAAVLAAGLLAAALVCAHF